MRIFLGQIIFLIVTSGSALAGDGYGQPVYEWWDQVPEGRGCYWVRQRQYCGRYCYTEVDGRRFCREHARDAHPQAPVPDAIIEWDGKRPRSMKLGGPSRP